MYILAIETSCDDTSIAIFKNDTLLAMDTASQIKIHNKIWWVVPELAAREHANSIFGVLDNVIEKVKSTHKNDFSLDNIDYIWVTTNPGLIPSLLTWVSVASSFSTILDKAIIPINHIEAHVFANFLERKESEISFPLVCLTVSGWHNDILYFKSLWDYEKIWTSLDDASGEAFDKVSKMMWLGYPGWPIISKYASEYTKKSNNLFPRVWLKKDEFDFSFSWLKSAVKREVDKRVLNAKEKMKDINFDNDYQYLSLDDKKEIAYEFEKSVVEVLAYKLINAWKKKDVKSIMLSGWVSANDNLRETIEKLAKKEKLNFIYPVKKLYSTDNAAMVWINTYYKIKYKKFEEKIWSLSI